MAKNIYLMRHGQTLFNTQRRVQGWSDSPLTELGQRQAEEVRRYFEKQNVSFQSAYSSTQERAIDTLKLVTDTPFEQLKGLKEMNFGIFEGREEELLPKPRPGANSFEDLLVPYGGEDIREVGKRVLKTILTICKEDFSDNILLVSHGAAIWGLVQLMNIKFPEGVFLSNCSICKMTYENGELYFNQLIDAEQNFKAYELYSGK